MEIVALSGHRELDSGEILIYDPDICQIPSRDAPLPTRALSHLQLQLIVIS